jgi:hypothetical protein
LSPPALPTAYQGEPGEGEGLASLLEVGEADETPEVETHETVVPAYVTPEAVERQRAQQRVEAQQPTPEPQEQPQPRARPRLTASALTPEVLRNSTRGTAATGALGYNANFSEYGDYLARALESVKLKWYDLNSYGRAGVDDTRTFVLIRFYIDKGGDVQDLEVLDTNASQISQWRCIDAIKSPAPYGDWTADMVRVLGSRQPVVIRFFYY